MTLTKHLALAGLATALLLPFRETEDVLLFAAASVLIDVDHYFFYVQRTRRFGVRGMFRYFAHLQQIQQGIPYAGLCLFHTVDFFLFVGILACFYPLFLPILAGFLFHFAADLIHLIKGKTPFIRAYCLLEHAIRRRAPGYPFC